MKEILNRLDIRTTDFVATVGYDDGFMLTELKRIAAGLACVGEIDKKTFSDLRNVRSLENEKGLDDGAFDKIVAVYDDYLSVDELIRASDHMGMILITDIPREIKDNKTKRLLMFKKFWDKGIYEVWTLGGKGKNVKTFDLLFRVRKYE